jgi:hypothetical protein
MIQFIREAAIRACERTLAWRYAVPLFDLLPGVHEYLYNKPETTDVHAVFATIMNDRHLQMMTLDQALRLYPKWADLYGGQSMETVWSLTPTHTYNDDQFNTAQFNQTSSIVLPDSVLEDASEPQAVCQLTPDKFIILPLPDDERTYTIRQFVALKPKRTATAMDSVILDELEDVIVHGALQHLLLLPNTAWVNAQLAAYHAKQFIFHIAERRARANLGNVRGMMRAQMQPFS